MSLEELIYAVRSAERACASEVYGSIVDYDECQGLPDAKRALLRFVMLHADELISWERTHAARTSMLDDDQ